MSRKIRIAKHQIAALPSPAWTYALLAGEAADVRLSGWALQAQNESEAADIWAQHQDALIAEADQHGFAPFWQDEQRPHGAGFAAWKSAFLNAHSY